MENKEFITKGEFYSNSGQVYPESGQTVALIPYFDKSNNEHVANSDLIADAFNTHNECGFTPSELLAHKNELTSALISVNEWLLPDNLAHNDGIIEMIKKAINHTK